MQCEGVVVESFFGEFNEMNQILFETGQGSKSQIFATQLSCWIGKRPSLEKFVSKMTCCIKKDLFGKKLAF